MLCYFSLHLWPNIQIFLHFFVYSSLLQKPWDSFFVRQQEEEHIKCSPSLSELHWREENIDILHRCPSSASQGHWHGWISITNPTVTLYFFPSFLSASLPVCNFMCPSFFHSPHFSLSLSSPDSYLLLLASHGYYIFWKERWQRQMKRCLSTTEISENPKLTSILSFFIHFLWFLPKTNFKDLWERQGSGRRANIRGHLEILEHHWSLQNVCQSRVLWLKISQGKGMMGFFCSSQSHFSARFTWPRSCKDILPSVYEMYCSCPACTDHAAQPARWN